MVKMVIIEMVHLIMLATRDFVVAEDIVHAVVDLDGDNVCGGGDDDDDKCHQGSGDTIAHGVFDNMR